MDWNIWDLGYSELEIEDKQSWQISGLAIKRFPKKIQTRLTLEYFCSARDWE
jgi:hypothetical protein